MMTSNFIRRTVALVAVGAALGFAAPAQATGPCAIDFNLNGTRDFGDVLIFLQIFPSSYCDINADGVVNNADATTFATYYGLPACPCWADYDGNAVIDVVDLFTFLNLYSIGSGRADLNLDGVVNAADITVFQTCFGNVGTC